MLTVLIKTFAFLLMICMGFGFKKCGVLHADDSRVLIKIVVNITMPAALISGFREFHFDSSLLFAIALGFGFNLVLMAAGYLFSVGRDGTIRALYLLGVPTYNIGSFVLPFVQGFLPGSAVLTLSMFDIGNNPIGAGMAYSAATSVSGRGGRLSLRDIASKLFHSPPFLAYLVMMLLYAPGVRLPAEFFDLVDLFGKGNAFLAMFILGLIFELHLGELKTVLRILGVRYALCIAAAAAVFLLTPFDLVVRQTLVLCLLGPITTLSIPFALQCGCKQSMTGALSSMSMLCSLVLIIGALVIWA